MHNTEQDIFDVTKPLPTEREDRWWYRVYLAVIVFTVFVIALLWSFSRYFTA